MSPDFFYTRLLWDSELQCYQFEQAAFPQSFYQWSGPECPTSHRVTKCSLTRVVSRDSFCNSWFQLLSAGQGTVPQLTARNYLICVLNHPPPRGGKRNHSLQWHYSQGDMGNWWDQDCHGDRKGSEGGLGMQGDDRREDQDWANKGLNCNLLTEQDVWGWKVKKKKKSSLEPDNATKQKEGLNLVIEMKMLDSWSHILLSLNGWLTLCLVNLDWRPGANQSCSITPLLSWTGVWKYDKKLTGWDKDREKSLTDCHHGQNRLREINWIYCSSNSK